MGGACSAPKVHPPVKPAKTTTQWKQFFCQEQILNKFISEGLVAGDKEPDQNEIELFALLLDDSGLLIFKKWTVSNPCNRWFACWDRMLTCDYSQMPKPESLLEICNTYSELLSTVCGDSKHEESESLAEQIQDCKTSLNCKIGTGDAQFSDSELNHIHLRLKRICFRAIFCFLYIPSIEQEGFSHLLCELCSTFNKVTADDFTYSGRIGRGAFGEVLKCEKTSTGEIFAMKVMLKANILRFYRKNPEKVLVERNALASFDHPFLMSLLYSFQTPTLVMMVMPLGQCGDLGIALHKSLVGRLPLDRVIFYTAEIISGLSYLHINGIIYRDLKPQNVLLRSDGHIMLADFGNIADTTHCLEILGGMTASVDSDCNSTGSFRMPLLVSSHNSARSLYSSPISARGDSVPRSRSSSYSRFRSRSRSRPDILSSTTGVQCSNSTGTINKANAAIPEDIHSSASTEIGRADSIVGTFMFMAPEIYQSLGCKQKIKYTKEVDCWSLGVLIYNMYTGQYPFRILNSLSALERAMKYLVVRHNKNVQLAFTELFGALRPFPRGCDDESICNLIILLLQFNPARRLRLADSPTLAQSERSNQQETKEVLDECLLYSTDIVTSYDVVRSAANGLMFDIVDSVEVKVGDGGTNIRDHCCFSGIDWELLERKGIPPPYMPSESMKSTYSREEKHSFISLMSSIDRERWVNGDFPDQNAPSSAKSMDNRISSKAIAKYTLTPAQQLYFSGWDHVAPLQIEVEMEALRGRPVYNS